MAGRDPVEVTIEIDGAELTAGTLWVHERGGQTEQRHVARTVAARITD